MRLSLRLGGPGDGGSNLDTGPGPGTAWTMGFPKPKPAGPGPRPETRPARYKLNRAKKMIMAYPRFKFVRGPPRHGLSWRRPSAATVSAANLAATSGEIRQHRHRAMILEGKVDIRPPAGRA